MALAVSLWIAGGSVASAADMLFLRTTDGDQLAAYTDPLTFDYGNYAIARRPAGSEIAYNSAQKTLTVTGGDWSGWRSISGGDKTATYSDSNDLGNVEGYHLTLTGVMKAGDVYGAHTTKGAAKNNWLVVSGTNAAKTEITRTAVGGRSSTGDATGNHVELTHVQVSGSNSWGNIVVGGWTADKEASGNFVTLTDSTTGAVLGGYADNLGTKTGDNTVTLLGGNTVNGDLLGGGNTDGGSVVTGNVLNLSGANIVNAGTGVTFNSGTVKNFETINIVSAAWGTPVLTLNGAGMAQNANGTWATIDAQGITFTGVDALNAGQKTILIKNKMTGFGGTILSGKYKVGTTLEGTGTALIADGDSDGDNDDLIYTIDKDTKMEAQEQTHNTVMGATASMAALSAGNDFVGAATEGLSMAGNTGTDGMATYANMGGGSMNVETGSHVKTHTWNAILALGHKNEKKLSTTEYGAFFEYGTGNYSTFNGDERGDGSTRYTGGGILGKWQKNNGFYVEGSLRAGSIHDDANNVLRDANGNPYSYTTDATYWGAHIGVGREIKLNKTAVLDLYAKYFYNHRGSVSFDAGGHYDLGAVESSVLRVGTRYTVKQNDNINYYGGLAVEHEFCGRASGFADGVAIRGADISGTSVRGEIGATFRPGDKSNVTLDLNLSGFAGKKQGFTGGLSAVFHI